MHTVQGDRMESFFLSETLKYLYLLLADEPEEPQHAEHADGGQANGRRADGHPLHPLHPSASAGGRVPQIDLSRYVLNTEAHPLRVRSGTGLGHGPAGTLGRAADAAEPPAQHVRVHAGGHTSATKSGRGDGVEDDAVTAAREPPRGGPIWPPWWRDAEMLDEQGVMHDR